MYYPDVGFRVVRCEAGVHPRDGREPLQAPAARSPLRGSSALGSPPRRTGPAEVITALPIGPDADATDACWRGNPRRTGEYPTRGVPKLGGLSWKFFTGGKVRSGPVVFDGVAYVGSDGGHFHAIDVDTGKERWKIAVPGGVRSSACVASGMVYFGGNDGKLYAADAKTGETAWTVQSRGYLSSAPWRPAACCSCPDRSASIRRRANRCGDLAGRD